MPPPDPPPDVLTWRLQIDDRAIGRAGFAIEGGRCEEVYISDRKPETYTEILDEIKRILGDCTVGVNKLIRVLPLAHPIYSWMFATQVDVELLGNVATNPLDPDDPNIIEQIVVEEGLEAPPINFDHVIWPRVALRVQFQPRPYAVLQDLSIGPATSLTYCNDEGGGATVVDSKEYLRFTDRNTDPAPQEIYAQHGQLCFRTASEAISLETDPIPLPHTKTFSGFPRQSLPDGAVQITWFQVPYSLTENPTHPMWAWVGRVNQQTFFRWTPGQLLYAGPKFRRYTPVVPAEIAVDGNTVSFSTEKLCDITFLFLYTARTGTDVPTPSNCSHIAAGHNLQPWWPTKKFHYVTAQKKGTDFSEPFRVPIFLSAPMQGLWRCS